MNCILVIARIVAQNLLEKKSEMKELFLIVKTATYLCGICLPQVLSVVNEYNEIALLRQNYVSATKYVCVAGIMKMGESAEETVIREVKEEIGQDVESLEFIKSYPYEKKEMLMLGYKATVKKKEFKLIQLSGLNLKMRWLC